MWVLKAIRLVEELVSCWCWLSDHIRPTSFYVSLCVVYHLALKPLLTAPFRLVLFFCVFSFLCILSTLFVLAHKPFPLSLYWWNLPSSWELKWVLRLCLLCFLSACVHYSAAALWPLNMTVSHWCYRRERWAADWKIFLSYLVKHKSLVLKLLWV